MTKAQIKTSSEEAGLKDDASSRVPVPKRGHYVTWTHEELLNLVIDGVPALISYIDSELPYQLTNRAHQEWFGLTHDETRGRHVKDVLGASAYESIRPRAEAAVSGKKVVFDAWVDYRKAGRRYIQAIRRIRTSRAV